jgi:hypothetical protein
MATLSVYFQSSCGMELTIILLLSDRVRAISMAMNMYPVMWTRINATATFDTDGIRLSF